MIKLTGLNFMLALVLTVVLLGLLLSLPEYWSHPFVVMFFFFCVIYIFIRNVVG